ncbi:MAG: M15 family metallopeptidase [Candidatus Saccharibacteria bacterium]|nr:M15 family metallopeptidase [Candidatus Saccharibacteria bacterium]
MKKILLMFLCATLFLSGCSIAINVEAPKKDNPYLVLVNKQHKLPDNWEDQITLVTSHDPWGDEVIIEETTLKQFEKLQAALLDRGIDIYLDSVYRSVDDQIALWNYFEQEYGEDYCKQYVAVPGYSEHHTGLAIDICITVDGEYVNDNDVMLAQTDLFNEVHALMPQFGFILRYPKGKEDITGYSYEPWHLRYVGPEVAQEITEKGLTLEEYLNQK